MIYVIIPTYNRAHTLLRAINSIFIHEGTHCIVIDDGSSDSTGKLIDSYLARHQHISDRFSYIYKENGGVCDAINWGIEHALQISQATNKDYLLFLGSDDELDKNNFPFIDQDLQLFPERSCFIFPMRNFNDSRVSKFKSQENRFLNFEEFLSGQYIEGSDKVDNLYVLRLSIFCDKNIRFPREIPGGEWLLFHKIIKLHGVVLISRYIYIVHISENSMTRRFLDYAIYQNQYNLQKAEIDNFGEDLLKINKRTLGYHCLILSRYCFVLKKYNEGFLYLFKGIKYAPVEIVRIFLCFVALLPNSIFLINQIIKIIGFKMELSKVSLADCAYLFQYRTPKRRSIPISHPIIEQEEIDAVVRVMKTGNIVQGNEVTKLEKSFSELTGKKYAIAVNSGTAAIHIGLYGLGIGEGDEVITSPFTFVASANPILMQHARVVFADINEDDYLINIDEIEKKITNKTKAIIPVSLYGQVYDFERLVTIAQKYNISLLEDACQSVGSIRNGVPSGACGDMGAFSLYATKNIMCGEGGILVTDNKEYADRARSFRQHGMEVSGSYIYQDMGYNYRLPDMLAAIANVQFGKLKNFTDKRRENALYLTSLLKDIPGVILPKENTGNYHVFHQYTIRVTEDFPLMREDLMAKLQADGIGLKVYYPIPIHLYPHFANLGYKEGDFPVAEKIAKQVFSLPIHPSVTREELRFVASRIRHYSQNL